MRWFGRGGVGRLVVEGGVDGWRRAGSQTKRRLGRAKQAAGLDRWKPPRKVRVQVEGTKDRTERPAGKILQKWAAGESEWTVLSPPSRCAEGNAVV